jgi:hypothetical protein
MASPPLLRTWPSAQDPLIYAVNPSRDGGTALRGAA